MRLSGHAVWAILLAAASALALSCSKQGGPPKGGVQPANAVPVLTAIAKTASVPLEISTFGEVQANSTVTIRAQVTGVLNKVHFHKGDYVKKDQLLFEIDARPFNAMVEQLQANKARDQAQLDNARKELARQQELVKKQVAAQADYDSTLAASAGYEAAVKADDAAIDNAKLQVDYCTILSPMDGRAGDLPVDPGNLVTANSTGLVTLDQIRPIQVYFSITQSDLPAVRKYMARGQLAVRAMVAGPDEPADEGVLTFIDNNVDPATRSVKLGATFPNEKEKLWPGQYVDVVLTLTVEKDVTVIPSQALQTGRDGQYVFVITSKGNDKIAEIRPIELHRKTDGLAIIETGLQSGDEVVTDGQVRLLPGAKVKVEKELPGSPASSQAGASEAGRSGGKASSQKALPASGPAGERE